jgi:hypothetical protein
VSRDPSLVRLGWKANVQQHSGSPTATVRISGCHCYSLRYLVHIAARWGALFDLTHGSLRRCDQKRRAFGMTKSETSTGY